MKAHNESKNIMNVAGTPLTLAFMWICLYLLSQVHNKVSLLYLSDLLPSSSLLPWSSLVLLSLLPSTSN